jgi:hypothetical protein
MYHILAYNVPDLLIIYKVLEFLKKPLDFCGK